MDSPLELLKLILRNQVIWISRFAEEHTMSFSDLYAKEEEGSKIRLNAICYIARSQYLVDGYCYLEPSAYTALWSTYYNKLSHQPCRVRYFFITEHVVPGSHIREYSGSTVTQDDVLHLYVKQYTPKDRPEPVPMDAAMVNAGDGAFPRE
ncbi:uncharacterized protein BO95DRAFT_432130 [Aspergillus brunneoviolaceus CBS 621.78]|uniref:Uncharacterized protein n=1 Tax=Aspergillus brunneoviolaceus CBS 621.78 TaxID=1450534 RepID=A0ACD1G8E6_9EURO|nr:hypothetical protein BO95DRAFT_432130 [Aspergillus brunneoviolaceus CBS 621.78]RAH45438.1 hypothetical protein BO95DRAFT_432130 [Aspergillus brunneoviolaceus CBS 621.78]